MRIKRRNEKSALCNRADSFLTKYIPTVGIIKRERNIIMKQNKFSKDFILVVIGQIISLFGNAVMRFALPIHLLNETGSAALLGLVSGCAFIPLAIMSPIGGLIADRVNKRNIMVCLDFFTAFLVTLFVLLYGEIGIVTIILVMLFLLYGISGAYQPSVQSSIPLLVPEEKVMSANAAINMVSSLSGLLGPALGGMAYAAWGIMPVLYVCIGCFAFSAVMEIFIKIPFEKRERKASLFHEVRVDLMESIHYIGKEQSEIGKLTICCAFINISLSALMIIGLPVVVMQVLDFPSEQDASRMYGFMQAILAVGGLAGGLCAGIMGSKMNITGFWKLLLAAGLLLIPIGIVLMVDCSAYMAYTVMAASGLIIMACATIFTIQTMSYVQIATPPQLIGKVIAWIIAISTCAQPIGQVLYGFTFEKLVGHLWIIFFAATAVTAIIAFFGRKVCAQLK